ncbi:hypothetical protein IWQ61_009812 [Dispira simplex]|nr:hypothetical protein IWQ61_009812 [Dispira simplex]
MSHYCSELKVVTDHSPSVSQGESTKYENIDEPKEWVEHVHQQLLLTPAGEPMMRLHPYGTRSGVATELPPKKALDFNHEVVHFFQQLFLTIHTLHKDHNVYHQDLSEGNILVVEYEMPNLEAPGETEKFLEPLLIDFNHARLKDDGVVDQMLSCMGTLPFMSILNLAGHTNHLTFIDEYGSGAIITKVKKTMVKASAGPLHPRTGHMDPQGLALDLEVKNTKVELSVPCQLHMRHLKNKENKNITESTFEMHNPLLEHAKHEEAVTEKFFTIILSE